MPTTREAIPARGQSYGGAALLIAAAAVAHDDDDAAAVGAAAEAIWSSWSCSNAMSMSVMVSGQRPVVRVAVGWMG